MVTKDDIDKVLNILDHSSEEYNILLKIKNNIDYDCTNTKTMNNKLKKLFNDDKATLLRLKDLFKVINPITTQDIIIDFKETFKIDINEYIIEPEFIDIIRKYDVYISSGYEDYPFILIELYPYKKYIRYNIYRYIVQLPYYIKLSETKYLPTVDHINRNSRHNMLNNMRYCTREQNNKNRCLKNRSESKYHGIKSDGSISISCKDENLQLKVIIWSIMFDEYLVNKIYPNQENYKYISLIDGCKKQYYDEFKHHAYIIDKFVEEMILFCNTSSSIYNKTFTKFDILKEDHDYKEVMQDIISSYKNTNKIYKTKLKHDYILAIIYDIIKYIEYGEYAHLNIIKRPITSTIKMPEIIKDPIEILNEYEQEQDNDYLNKIHENQYNIQEINKVKKYEYNNGNIIAKFIDRTVDYKSILNESSDKLTSFSYYISCKLLE